MINEIEEGHELTLVKEFIYNDEIQNTFYQINNRIKTINFFEIAGMGNQEIKHSRTLGWLLGNNQHTLENIFFNAFLKLAISSTYNLSGNTFNNDKIDKLKNYIYLIEYKDLEILYEYKNIDILIIDKNNKYIFILENKVFASEDKKQLEKYRNSIANDNIYEGYEVFGLYLTPEGRLPSEKSDGFEENRNFYLSVSYKDIEKIIKEILENKHISMKDETKYIIEHYLDLLIRSNIVHDKELENICKDIWKNETYSKALEILDNYKPDIDLEIKEYLIEKLNNLSIQFIQQEDSSKSYIRFSDTRLDDIEGQMSGEGWSKNINRVILFEFGNEFNNFGLKLKLLIGPGDYAFREKIFNNCQTSPFKPSTKKLNNQWNQIKSYAILSKTDKKENIFEKIDIFIDKFFGDDGDFNILYNALKKDSEE